MDVSYTGTLDEAADHLAEQAGKARDQAEQLRTASQRDAAVARACGLEQAVEVLRNWHLPASDSGTVLEEFAATVGEQGAPPKVVSALTDAAKLVREWQAKPA